MTPRNKMAYNLLQTCRNDHAPFINSAISVSSEQIELQKIFKAVKIFRMAILGG